MALVVLTALGGCLYIAPPGTPFYTLLHRGQTVDVSGVSAGLEAGEPRPLKMYTVIGKDGIRAILNPSIISAQEAATRFQDHERVIGLSLNGAHRAYSIPQLSNREIVNDVVGGVPVAVTW